MGRTEEVKCKFCGKRLNILLSPIGRIRIDLEIKHTDDTPFYVSDRLESFLCPICYMEWSSALKRKGSAGTTEEGGRTMYYENLKKLRKVPGSIGTESETQS